MYPLIWKAEGADCLVIGAGHVALRKIKRLLSENARVTVLAPEAVPEIRSLAGSGAIRYLARPFAHGDERGFSFVISTSGDEEIARYLSERAKTDFFLYNAADFPPMGNCHVPASFRRGSLTVSLSTEGKSPAFSKYIKESLERDIPEHYGEWLDRVAALREEAKARLDGSRAREAFWRAAFGREVTALVREGHLEEAEERIRYAMECFRAEP